jgi:hypothetical protein
MSRPSLRWVMIQLKCCMETIAAWAVFWSLERQQLDCAAKHHIDLESFSQMKLNTLSKSHGTGKVGVHTTLRLQRIRYRLQRTFYSSEFCCRRVTISDRLRRRNLASIEAVTMTG